MTFLYTGDEQVVYVPCLHASTFSPARNPDRLPPLSPLPGTPHDSHSIPPSVSCRATTSTFYVHCNILYHPLRRIHPSSCNLSVQLSCKYFRSRVHQPYRYSKYSAVLHKLPIWRSLACYCCWGNDIGYSKGINLMPQQGSCTWLRLRFWENDG